MFHGVILRKYKIIGASIIVSTFIICSYALKWYKVEKSLHINSVSQELLVSEALQLSHNKAIIKMIENGQTEELLKSLKNHIEIQQDSISLRAKRYDFDERQLETIEHSLRDIDND